MRMVLSGPSFMIIFILVLDTDIVHFTLFGTNVIVLNSVKAASDLFDKRSTIYSDR